ncbi:hypothetical protein XCV2731 [Xanthomonas euvesicatoria pv. vesicatoria str. 85-10]|uniref:Uncharacterized protein n=1 Tax=Xanthomonas euvesicatoria pv. vesicatoria (strain 85-10) TaxID=316273 RepID=Q3BS01_XANE5|nr:hypothetical protein XCV2731 [Xanthomonas euvesicatoria pv. vesicatoria str. 85-10]
MVDHRDQGTSHDRAEMSLFGQCRHARKQAQARDFPHASRLNSSRRRSGVVARFFSRNACAKHALSGESGVVAVAVLACGETCR